MLQVSNHLRIAKGHFMNSVRLFPGRYSCAIDSFLELWLNKLSFLPGISEGNENEFFALLNILKVRYDQVVNITQNDQFSRHHEMTLFDIREPLWEYLRQKCPSLRPMDCEAQFSEIFTRQVFGYLSNLQKDTLLSRFRHSGNCARCSTVSNVEVEVFVHYVTRNLGGYWPEYLLENSRSNNIHCSNCSEIIPVTSFDCNMSDILFVEFSQQAMAEIEIEQSIIVDGMFYELQGMVRNTGSHFACAYHSMHWYYVDDLCLGVDMFPELISLVESNERGWFFFVYLKSTRSVNVDHNYSQDFHSFAEHSYSLFTSEKDNLNKSNNSKDRSKNFDSFDEHSYSLFTSEKNNFNKSNNFKDRPKNFDSFVEHSYSLFTSTEKSYTSESERISSKSSVKGSAKNENKKEKKKKVEGSLRSVDTDTKDALADSDKEARKFHDSMKMTIKQCDVCFEAWPVKNSYRKSKNSINYICGRCRRDKRFPKKFSRENDMIPGDVPVELKGLTQCEEMLVSLAFPVMLVYTRPGAGYLGYKGHVITLPHNVQKVATILPNLSKDLPIAMFKYTSKDGKEKDFKVRRQVVLDALNWLIENNFLYKNVVLDYDRLNQIPVEGYLEFENYDCAENLTECVDLGPSNDDEDIRSEIQNSSLLPEMVSQPKELNRFEETITSCELDIDTENPFNEFSTPYLAAMSFPTLFPDSKGDPTFMGTRRQIAESETESFAEKLKHLIKFATFKDSKWDYRFAAHPRFAFWAYNILYRKRLLSQGSYFIRHHPLDVDLDIDELRNMLAENSYQILMNKIMYYAKNITGTNSYWLQQRNNLKATISQVGVPTIFWTLSCAEFHWPDFHYLLSDSNIFHLSSDEIRNNIVNNQHLLDWFFTERTESFVKHWLYNTMKASWHWFRYEFTVNRGSIHCHGLAKLKTDPGLCELSKTALNGYLAERKIDLKDYENKSEWISLLDVVKKGKDAENIICDYHDSLISCCNPLEPSEWTKPDIHPCKLRYECAVLNEDDYGNLVNSVQRHTKCNSAYCLRFDINGNQACRFKFPIESCDKTHILYEEVHKKSGLDYRPVVVGKRNDPRLNRHQKIQLTTWRANCDIQLIIDYRACVDYIAKYASKSEKMSSVVQKAFVSVVSNVTNETNPKSAIRKLLLRGVGERDYSKQEIMHCILSLKLCSSSFEVITVGLNNTRKLEFKNQEVTTKRSYLDQYATRCDLDDNLRSTNLIDFFAKYKVKNNKIEKRSTKVVVKTFPSFSSNPQGKGFEKYCKYQLIKYKPWVDYAQFDVDEQEEVCFIQLWEVFLESDIGKSSVPNWEREMHEIESYLSNDRSDMNDENCIENLEKDEWMYLSHLQSNHISKDLRDESLNLEEGSFHAELQTLNNFRSTFSTEQINNMPFWIDHMKNNTPVNQHTNVGEFQRNSLNLEQELAFSIVETHFRTNCKKPLKLIINGQGGSGKSYVLRGLKELLSERCILCSYFGIAAFNISGQTLHSFFQLPIAGRRRGDLKGQSLIKLQQNMSNVKYIIIDEYSVLGQKMFGHIDRRCRQATGNMLEPFGGLSIVLVGDIAQLPPISDKVLYHMKPTDDVSMQGFCAYMGIDLVVELETNQRACEFSQKEFRDILLRLRNGNNTESDWEILNSRSFVNFSQSYVDEFSVYLAYSNETVAKHNFKKLKDLEKQICVIDAKHNVPKATVMSFNDFGGLESRLFICEGARVMLTRNLWIASGLCNGSMGLVRQIIYKEGDRPPSLPVAVMVEFDKYHGPSFDCRFPNCIPIVPVLSEINSGDKVYERLQLPLRLSWAITIHKSQGLTLTNAFIDIGLSEKVSGLSYVAFSRMKHLNSFVVNPFSLDRLQSVKKSKQFKFRLHEEERLHSLSIKTKEIFQNGVNMDLLYNYL